MGKRLHWSENSGAFVEGSEESCSSGHGLREVRPARAHCIPFGHIPIGIVFISLLKECDEIFSSIPQSVSSSKEAE